MQRIRFQKYVGERMKRLRDDIQEQERDQSEEIENCRREAKEVMLGRVVQHMQ
jgi:hypothetical protein